MKSTSELLRVMLAYEPYALRYRFRSSNSGYKEDKSLLDQLVSEGLIKLSETTATHKTYTYCGPTENLPIKIA